MKKLFCTLLCALLIALCVAPASFAVGQTMTVTKGTPVIDGVIDEIWASAERVQLGYLKAGDLKGDGTLPETSSAYASMLWDDGALYVLCEIYDDDFSFEAAQGAWQNDSFYIYIDEQNLKTATWADGQSQIALIPSEGLTMVPRNGTAPLSYESQYTFPSDGYCVIEFKYQPAIITLSEGISITVDFQYNDSIPGQTRDYCFGWSDETDGASSNSNIWGDITLGAAPAAAVVEPEPEPVAEPVVEAPVEEAAEPVVEAPAVEVTVPQTSDVTSAAVLVAMLGAVAAFAVSRKKTNVK